jgi:hypothetical protein
MTKKALNSGLKKWLETHHRKHRGRGFLSDAWNWTKNLFKSGKVGDIAKTVGDLTGHKGISDLGNKV